MTTPELSLSWANDFEALWNDQGNPVVPGPVITYDGRVISKRQYMDLRLKELQDSGE